jgi:molybdate transport system substrate-binding protein
VRGTAVWLIGALTLLAACGGSGPAAPDDGPGGSNGSDGSSGSTALTGTLTVLAAASLADVFSDLGAALERSHPGLDVRFSFAGSSTLARQAVQGAPADVFASADEAQMAVVSDAAATASVPSVFAANVLQIAVPTGNPAGVTGLHDLARDDLAVALCAAEVPCGRAAGEVFAAAGVAPAPDTLEEDVRAALTKVKLREVDAALVYASDVAAAGGAVEGIDVPEAEQAVNRYPIAVLAGAPNPGAARAFVDLVLSEDGRTALRDAGFREP